MRPERNRFALFDFNHPVGYVQIKKLRQHGKCLGVSDQLHLGIFFCRFLYVRRMIGFQMGNNLVIRLFAAENVVHIREPFIRSALVHRIHDRDLII